jgi:glycosidase
MKREKYEDYNCRRAVCITNSDAVCNIKKVKVSHLDLMKTDDNQNFVFVLTLIFLLWACETKTKEQTNKDMNDSNLLKEQISDHKIIIYQVFTRLFGNKNTTNKAYGSIEENGVGKMSDFDETALKAIKKMGVTHIWYTGIVEHATMNDNTKFGIPLDDADVVKGIAGSPYAIKDYYDINPDLAVDVPNRMKEFEGLINRTHKNGMKFIIDFVPNHVARGYKSDAKPSNIKDLGEEDDKTKSFSPHNNFYYLPNTKFVVPSEYQLPEVVKIKTKNGVYEESPAKATGNDVFTNAPSINDWFETIKLNYGVDIQNGGKKNFDSIPDTWLKMRDILLFWTEKKVDGFRCDMAEMVPVEFWSWVIPQVKQANPAIIFIAEIYNPNEYKNYIDTGKFDYLYDKVGLYDTLKAVIQQRASASDIKKNWKQTESYNHRMLRFLENHDEQRIGCKDFAGEPRKAFPAMVVSALLNSGPVMIYFGQEVGEKGGGVEGFGGDDGRTTIFDYWGVPTHQKLMNGGKFDGGGLSEPEKEILYFYTTLLNFCTQNEAIRLGNLYDLQSANTNNYDAHKVYAFLRFTENQKLLIIVNFDTNPQPKDIRVQIPSNAAALMGLSTSEKYKCKEVFLNGNVISANTDSNSGIVANFKLSPLGSYIYSIEKQ